MSSICPPSAATCGPSPSQLSTFTPFDHSDSAAPTGRFSRMRSYTTTSWPSFCNARAADVPPMPAPMTMTFMAPPQLPR